MILSNQSFSSIKQDLVKNFGIESSNKAHKEKFFQALELLLGNILLSVALQNLDSTKGKTFLQLLQKDGTGEKAFTFAKTMIPDFETDIRNTVLRELSYIEGK